MKKLILILTCLLCLSAAGCGNNDENTESSGDSAQTSVNYAVDNLSETTYMDSGIIYREDQRIYYYDAQSDQTVVICSDPSCKHEKFTITSDSDCTGVVNCTVNSLCYLNGKLYLSYPENGDALGVKTLFAAEVDGSNRKPIAEIDAQVIDQTLFTNDSVIIAYSNPYDLSAINNGVVPEVPEWEAGIYTIDLESGETVDICSHKAERGKISKVSFDGENIYYLFEYTEDMLNHGEIYRYNLESREDEMLKAFENAYFYGGFNTKGVLYTTYSGQEYSLHNYSFGGEDVTVDTVTDSPEGTFSGYYYLDDNSFIYNKTGTYYLYDLNAKESKLIGKPCGVATLIFAVLNDKIYLSCDESNTLSVGIGYLTKEDFLNGDFDKVVTVRTY